MKLLITLIVLAAPAYSQFTNAKSIWSRPVASTAPSDTNTLCWDATAGNWKPCTAAGSTSVKTLYYAPAAKNISGVGVPAYQCISNCPSPSAISSGSAATAELLVTTNTSNMTSQDQFIVPATFANQTTTIEIIWRTSDTTVAHTATVTPTFVCVGTGDVANPTFAAAGGAITLTPPGNTNRTVTTNTFTPSCTAGNTAFWLLSYNTTSGGGGAITNLGILSVRFYATF